GRAWPPGPAPRRVREARLPGLPSRRALPRGGGSLPDTEIREILSASNPCRLLPWNRYSRDAAECGCGSLCKVTRNDRLSIPYVRPGDVEVASSATYSL